MIKSNFPLRTVPVKSVQRSPSDLKQKGMVYKYTFWLEKKSYIQEVKSLYFLFGTKILDIWTGYLIFDIRTK